MEASTDATVEAMEVSGLLLMVVTAVLYLLHSHSRWQTAPACLVILSLLRYVGGKAHKQRDWGVDGVMWRQLCSTTQRSTEACSKGSPKHVMCGSLTHTCIHRPAYFMAANKQTLKLLKVFSSISFM